MLFGFRVWRYVGGWVEIKEKKIFFFKALKENEWQPNHDPFKSDVFCLGISFLEMITLKSSSSIFDFQKHLIFDDEIISTINEIKEMYSTGLGNFIQNMLYINEEKRKNFIELRLLLEKRHIQEDSIQVRPLLFCLNTFLLEKWEG